MRGRCVMQEQRWDDDRANHLLGAARVVLEAAGGWQTPEDDYGDDPASLLRYAELYFSEGVRRRIWPHVDLMNRGIRAGDLEDLRLERVMNSIRNGLGMRETEIAKEPS